MSSTISLETALRILLKFKKQDSESLENFINLCEFT